jgi:hypothetical protein
MVLDDSSRYGGPSTDILVGNLEPSNHIKRRGSSNHHVPNMPETHYNFNNSHDYTSKPQTIRSKTALPMDWSGGPDRAFEPSLHELVYKSNIRDAASVLLTQSYEGGENWPLPLAQSDALHPGCVLHLGTPTFQITGEQRLPHSEWLPRVESDPQLGKVQEKERHQDTLDHYKTRALSLEESVHNVPASVERKEQMIALEDDVGRNYEMPKSQELRTTIRLSGELLGILDEDVDAEEQDCDPEAAFTEYGQDHLRNNDLGIFVAFQATQGQQDRNIRTYHSFIDCYAPDMLTAYQPSAQSSPLTDSTTARIFYHFINVIAPSISMYERHPANPSLLFQGRPVHISQQHIWACKFVFQIYIVQAY